MRIDIYTGPRPLREIRAVYDSATIRVYQAFSREIALPALEAQTFVPPFSFVLSWASWIKPSFLWTMKRTAWGRFTRISSKGGSPEHEGNAVVLAVDVKREFFDKALAISQTTHYPFGFDKKEWNKLMKNAAVYAQWDPEKDIHGQRRPWKAVQIGLRTPVLRDYADSIIRITDMTETISQINSEKNNLRKIELLPDERPYPVSPELRSVLGMD